MVAPGAFPLAKLGFLLIKQVAKPVAKSIAASAKQSRLFRDYVCIPVAQLFHFYEVRVKMKALNLGAGKVTKVPKLSEAKAVEQGAEILSEMIILSIASAILIYEYNRSSEKDAAKEAKLKADRESIKNKIFELELRVEKQSTQIRSLAKTAIHLEEEVQKKSLKGIIKGPEVPKDLIETVEAIPEIPKEVKPLELSEDKIESEEIPEDKPDVIEVNPLPTKTPIQELVEKHYARPSPAVIVDNPVNDIDLEQSNNTSSASKPEGMVADALSFVLENVFRSKNKDQLINTSAEERGIIQKGIEHLLGK